MNKSTSSILLVDRVKQMIRNYATRKSENLQKDTLSAIELTSEAISSKNILALDEISLYLKFFD